MCDLISREALREDLRRFFPTEVLEGIEPKTLFAQIMHDIDNAPTAVDVKGVELAYNNGYKHAKEKYKRPQGEWIENNYGRIQCSICKGAAISTMTGCLVDRHLEQYKTRFCPWCGADMQKGGAV